MTAFFLAFTVPVLFPDNSGYPEDQHQGTKTDTVPSEGLEVMLPYKAQKPLYNNK